MRWLTVIGVLACMRPALAQHTITCRVVNATDGTPLAYATVTIQGTTRGTFTNVEGWFRLHRPEGSDSLRISHVGHRTRALPFTPGMDSTDIRLESAVHQLREAVVRPEEDLYARVITASKWLRRAPEVNARLFFGLDTHSGGQPVEMLHAYFNATYKSAMLRSLLFKQGSVGITPKDGRHFINHNTAGAFALMDIHATAGPFPRSPFAYASAARLKQDCTVERIASGTGPDAVDHLRVTPRAGGTDAFGLDLWLVAGTGQVRSLELHCAPCARHPFTPLFPHGRIGEVDMRYRQTWSTTGRPLPEVMELEYTVHYTGPGFTEQFHTHAVMHAFDHDRHFIPTLFPWKSGMEEYPMIAWMPTDTAFWERMTPPVPTQRQQRDQAFIQQHDLRRTPWYDSLRMEHHHLRPHYTAWSARQRIDSTHLGGSPPERLTGPPPPLINLRTHLYLDLDTSGGRLTHRSMAVLDGGGSWYLLAPWERRTDATINLFFDLCEMERRAMEERLSQPGISLSQARRIHGEHTQRMRDEQKRLMATIAHDPAYLMGWNMKVRDALGVDNLQLLVRGGGPPE